MSLSLVSLTALQPPFTLGADADSVVPTTDTLEWKPTTNRLHYTPAENRLHYTPTTNRLHYKVER